MAIWTAVSVLPASLMLYLAWKAFHQPRNNPRAFLRQKEESAGPVVVCAGDSLTHGTVGADFVAMLDADPRFAGFRFVNAGINGHLAWNLWMRLDEIIACDPDIVILLIGTNDANSRLSFRNEQRYIRQRDLPQVPDKAWYRDLLERIVTELRESTRTNQVLVSLPTMGEVPEHPAFRRSAEYSAEIRSVAEAYGLEYLPLHETMAEALNRNPSAEKHDFSRMHHLLIRNIVMHYLFGHSWNRIAADLGFHYHVDHLHLSTEGARMAAQLIADCLVEEPAAEKENCP